MKKQLSLVLLMILGSLTAYAGVQNFNCLGTEPFYSLRIENSSSTFHYSDPATPKERTSKIRRTMDAEGVQVGMITVYKGDNASASVISKQIAGVCSDGMSDTEYAYHLIYNEGDVVKYGCCNLAK